MKSVVLRIIESNIVTGLRFALYTTTLAILIAVVITPTSAQSRYKDADPEELAHIALEHRLTALESNQIMMKEDISDLKFLLKGALLGLIGLLGEAGVRVVKGKS